MHEWHHYTTRTAPKTFMTEVLFVDSLKIVFLPWIEARWQRMQYQGSVILLLDGHATHLTPQVLANAASQRIIITIMTKMNCGVERHCRDGGSKSECIYHFFNNLLIGQKFSLILGLTVAGLWVARK
jgi:hypothetical protein